MQHQFQVTGMTCGHGERAVVHAVRSIDEVDGTLAKETAYEEASRCLRCYRLYSVVTEKAMKGGQPHAQVAGARSNHGAATAIAG